MRGELLPGDVEVAGGQVVGVGLSPRGRRGIAVPGFVDLQVNGFAGVDFLGATAAGWASAGEALRETGVTAYQPTFITAAEDVLVDALRSLPRDVIGAQLEGPFLSPERLGAHPAAHRRDPDVALLDRLLDAGRVTTLTLAPELPGAPALIRRARERGAVVGAGHTDATAEEANAAFDLGVSTVNHVFNAMRPFTQRDPGIGAAALVRPDVVVQMIVDGRHLADDTVRLVWRAAAGRVALVSDATAASARGQAHTGSARTEITVVDGVSAAPRRNARRDDADDDRRGAQPSCTRRVVRGCCRRGDDRARACPRPKRSRRARRWAAGATSSCSTIGSSCSRPPRALAATPARTCGARLPGDYCQPRGSSIWSYQSIGGVGWRAS